MRAVAGAGLAAGGDEAGAVWARASSRRGRVGGRAGAADSRTWLRALA